MSTRFLSVRQFVNKTPSSYSLRQQSTMSKLDNEKGEFVRKQSTFRNFITTDGSSGFKAEAGRYHLYVSYACPWASRTLMVRALKGLENVISFNVVDYLLQSFLDKSQYVGWTFTNTEGSETADTLNNCENLKQIYLMADPEYNGRNTVPVLWDKKTKTIVNNESSEIIRMLNSEFNAFSATPEQAALNLYPENLRPRIDELNEWIYPMFNNGVYRAGFATTQSAYDVAVREVFQALDKLEDILSKSRYLTGNSFTEADIRLFVTLIRFDMVYVGHFKCNKKRIVDYPNIWGYTRDIYQMPATRNTVRMDHITKHYMQSHTQINPYRIVSIGPDINFDEAHDRAKL